MNKYWIHSCTGQKAELYTLPCCDDDKGWVKLIKKEDSDGVYVNNALLLKISNNDFHNYWIPITKAEYDSSLTLEEIKRNRDNLYNKLVQYDEILCKSDCKSLGFVDIEAGDVLRVNIKAEDIVILYGLTEGIKNKRLAVTSDDINEHFMLYNTEDRTEEYVHNEKKEDMKDTFESLCQEMVDVHKAKNHDYGDSFHNLFKELGINYAYGHLKEKLERIKTLKDNEAKVKSESMIDSLKDLANYAIMTIIELQDGKKN